MDLSVSALQRAAKEGFKRTRNFRAARLMYIRDYVGAYYDKDHGELGEKPLNMVFNAVRVLVPNLVTRIPSAEVETEFLSYRQYGDLLSLALKYLCKKLKLTETLRRGIIDAIFTMGIFKTGLSTSDSLIYCGEEAVDPGHLYVVTVDLDDFTFDPDTKRLDISSFLGERIRADREKLLESGLYDNGIIEKLPSSADLFLNQQKSVRSLSQSLTMRNYMTKLHDSVDLLELWLREPQMSVTVPYEGGNSAHYARVEDFYGPSSGPYTLLSLTPEVPDNPLPVALAGVWHDLHHVINRIAKKSMDQALAQKDVLGYQRQYADDAQELIEARNLDAVPMEDPKAAQMYSFGGQNPKNEQMISQLSMWFNQMSGNTELLGGTSAGTDVATIANIFQQNIATGISYMRDRVYDVAEKLLENCAWYLHTDPLIQMPLIKRDMLPAQYGEVNGIIQMTSAPQSVDTQIFLTPEVRQGDFLDFAFKIKPNSMAPINWSVRLQQLEMLAVRIFPAAAAAAQISAQMGAPFSFKAFIMRTAKLMDIEWIDEIFQDPELIGQMMMMAQRGPQPGKGKSIASGSAVRQNQGGVVQKAAPTPQRQFRQNAQMGANEGQGNLPIREI